MGGSNLCLAKDLDSAIYSLGSSLSGDWERASRVTSPCQPYLPWKKKRGACQGLRTLGSIRKTRDGASGCMRQSEVLGLKQRPV